MNNREAIAPPRLTPVVSDAPLAAKHIETAPDSRKGLPRCAARAAGTPSMGLPSHSRLGATPRAAWQGRAVCRVVGNGLSSSCLAWLGRQTSNRPVVDVAVPDLASSASTAGERGLRGRHFRPPACGTIPLSTRPRAHSLGPGFPSRRASPPGAPPRASGSRSVWIERRRPCPYR